LVSTGGPFSQLVCEKTDHGCLVNGFSHYVEREMNEVLTRKWEEVEIFGKVQDDLV
jgi:hypothetical protein